MMILRMDVEDFGVNMNYGGVCQTLLGRRVGAIKVGGMECLSIVLLNGEYTQFVFKGR